ncbi:MerR family transcriptional regulator [Spongiactinospora sp. TRM90649]|uniref:MerR family transcriptional regulator n=1 Tax=Spongiactinospora sp. TRM90649 TaxID=3031114 RepID=UPI0023F7D073|nr:MerR family transcriptional regulator [Spongiactinospora sp. TRM90649]MDF5758893.1 MerR family transcriptional regulator [Spongiactinospora sp. TRM90649]
MDGERFLTIGDLARRTGLTIKTIRFYADRGIVPPTTRNAAGHRLYDAGALARLELVRTLRDLGLDLRVIREIVAREASLPEVAASHAAALTAQIEILRLRRAVLTTVARRGTTPEEMDLTHRLATMSKRERTSLIDDFLDSVFDAPEHVVRGIRTTMTPHLPDDPEPEQMDAWVELAELTADPGFRTRLRTTIARLTAGGHTRTTPPRPDLAATVRERVAPALAAGIDPASPAADATATALLANADADDLLAGLEFMNDPRRDRYFELLAVINAWPSPRPLCPSLSWAIQALRTRRATGTR